MKTNLLIDNLQRKSLAETIGDLLRAKILNGELEAGTQLKQDYLSKQYEVSVGAVREALKILAGEGLVEFTANKGATIARLSAEEALDIFAIRILLETEALALSVPYLTEDDFIYLSDLVEQETKCEDPKYYNEINKLFHATLYKYCSNRYLNELIEQQHNIVGRYLVFYLDRLDFKVQSNNEHRAILEACQAGEFALAKRKLKKHMQQAGKKLAQFLQIDKMTEEYADDVRKN